MINSKAHINGQVYEVKDKQRSDTNNTGWFGIHGQHRQTGTENRATVDGTCQGGQAEGQ